MEFDAPPPGTPNPQFIYKVSFESLFGPVETTLDSEYRSRPSPTPNPPISQDVYGLTPAFHPFDYDVLPSRVEVEKTSTSIP